ncbi:MAG: phosphatase [Candidatus Margulisbacteria bacterium]|nr:phosphatase [Candidatus Margulisiibacteriota bacterium]MBU1021120.1 phosphatase [Candidatus Margulisiibacteriota bacterium]MBU1728675.1 phosphatase [Candidatus Margulisiibacteriota bacterium]MBU1955126.1 phosphatase [Candidatus Margulisiibacteriota bacterium]
MKIIADLHLHTIASGHAFSTIKEYVQAAQRAKLKYIAITDHGPAMPGGAHQYHFSNLRMLPNEVDGITLLKGAEANIKDAQGNLDLPDFELSALDIVIASIHPRCGYNGSKEKENTKALKGAMQNQHVKVIGHPGNPRYPVNIKEIVGFAKESGVLIEINNASLISWARKGSEANCLEFAQEVKRQNWFVCIGSDSHFIDTVGNCDAALALIKEAGIPADHVVNASKELVREWFFEGSRKL